MDDVRFRPAAVGDVPALVALYLEARLAASAGPAPVMPAQAVPPGLASELAEQLTAELAAEAEAVVFEVDERVAGFALFRWAGGEVQLTRFVVGPAFREEGLGVEAFQWLYDNVWSGARVHRVGLPPG